MNAPVTDRRLWLGGILLALVVGVAVAGSPLLAAGLALAALVLYGYGRSRVRAELVVGLYWITFELYLSVFAGTDVPGLFYPFYAAFGVALLVVLVRAGWRADPVVLALYLLFLGVVAASFLDFGDRVDFGVTQRVLAYLFGGIVLFQIGSRRGLNTVAAAALLGSSAASAWVILSAARGGFGYRADVAMDPNVVAFLVGIGAVMAAGLVIDALDRRATPALALAATLLMGVHVYAVLLLASRGMAIALALSMAALMVRAALHSRRNLAFALVFAVVTGGAFLLPGGQGLFSRFVSERVETGGSRFPIWQATVDAYQRGDVRALLLGQGFDSSKTVVRNAFVNLTSTHNAFVQMLFEFGLVGLTLFVLLHLVLLARSWRLRSGHGLFLYGIVVFLLGGDLSLNIPDGFAYWTALGFAMALGVWGANAPPRARHGSGP